jgi:hypothetical protein
MSVSMAVSGFVSLGTHDVAPSIVDRSRQVNDISEPVE